MASETQLYACEEIECNVKEVVAIGIQHGNGKCGLVEQSFDGDCAWERKDEAIRKNEWLFRDKHVTRSGQTMSGY